MDECPERDEHRHLRRIAFLAIVVSTAAVISSIVTLPMLYSFVQTLESHLMVEADYCKSRTMDMWSEMTALQIGRKFFNRIKREWLFGQWVPDSGFYGSAPAYSDVGGSDGSSGSSNNIYGGTPVLPSANSIGLHPVLNSDFSPLCCTCHQGPAGLPGPEGTEGRKGADGRPGKNGRPGKDSKLLPAPPKKKEEQEEEEEEEGEEEHEKKGELCTICPPGPQGPPGPMGPRGPPGPKGASGEDGADGEKGEQGLAGQPGTKGRPGQMGKPGAHGPPGRLIHIPGPIGPDGPSGELGDLGPKGDPGIDGISYPGSPGEPGDSGSNGPEGKRGPPGPPGQRGEDGPRGSCAHCPSPRIPPGY